MNIRLRAVAAAAFGGAVVVAGLVAPAEASHGPFPISTVIYRIAYLDGTDVTVTQDHHSHGGPMGNKNRIDMSAGAGSTIVAAASGWIRAVVDFHGNSPGAGDGLAADGVTPQDDSLEHSCQDGSPAVPNSVVAGLCQDHNNYVWIEHPNGEWSKYTHFGTGTVTANNWAPGDWINAGEVLGLEGDVGRATGPHLHHEIAQPNTPGTDLVWTFRGGFMQNGFNVVPLVCDIDAPNLYLQGDTWTANPCDHDPPTAEAGGPYVVAEGSSIQLDGTGSNDPDGNPLSYLWDPADNLDDASLAQPTYTGVDDGVEELTLSVYDQIEQLVDSDTATVTVTNVAPSVSAIGDTIDEAGTAVVSATFTDPGPLDTHTMQIDWGDGGPITLVPSVAQLANGVSHIYGDDGTYEVTVQVTDDDGGVGADTVDVVVGNVPPSVLLGVSDTVSFPGGDYAVVEAGGELAGTADGSDVGSDDLTFSWSTGDVATYYNDGMNPDPFPSPFGTFPFFASDSVDAGFAVAGVDALSVTLTDDDGGSDDAAANVIVTGTADSTFGQGWWKHQYSGQGAAHTDADLADAYLDIVNAVSSVFSETQSLGSAAEAHDVLSPPAEDWRARAEAQLLLAWLHFASGAVSWDATVTLAGGDQVAFLDLIFSAEQTIVAPLSSDAGLQAVEHDLRRIGHSAG